MIRSVIDLLQFSDEQLQKVEFLRPGVECVEALCTENTLLSPAIGALTVKQVKIPCSKIRGHISLHTRPHNIWAQTVLSGGRQG